MYRSYFVYIMASRRNGTLYIGVTNDIVRRTWEHREGQLKGFTRDHGVKRLVWYEAYENIDNAISREKQIKHWERAWKIRLIEEIIPTGGICGGKSQGRSQAPRYPIPGSGTVPPHPPAVILAQARTQL